MENTLEIQEGKIYKRFDGTLTDKLIKTETGFYWDNTNQILYYQSGKKVNYNNDGKSFIYDFDGSEDLVECIDDKPKTEKEKRKEYNRRLVISDAAKNSSDLCGCTSCRKIRTEILNGFVPKYVSSTREMYDLLQTYKRETNDPSLNSQIGDLPEELIDDLFFMSSVKHNMRFFVEMYESMIKSPVADKISDGVHEFYNEFLEQTKEIEIDDEMEDFDVEKEYRFTSDKRAQGKTEYEMLKEVDILKWENYNKEELIEEISKVAGKFILFKNTQLIFGQSVEELLKLEREALVTALISTTKIYDDLPNEIAKDPAKNPKKILLILGRSAI